MTAAEPPARDISDAVARQARDRPETPFLFYRDARGRFLWWSFSRAAAYLEQGGLGDEKHSVKGVEVEGGASVLPESFLRAALGGAVEALEVPSPESDTARDVWISWRPLTDPAELALARWAIASGAAILVEPGPALHPELFAWARPTVVSGSVGELVELAGQVESLAPRFLRQRWYRQRAERLRLVLVLGAPAPGEIEEVANRWRAMSKRFSPLVAPWARDSLV